MDSGRIMMIISVLWLGSEIILARTKRSQPADVRVDRSSLRILWMVIALSVTIGVIAGDLQVGRFGGGKWIFRVAGIALIVCGMLIRWIAILSLKHQFTVDVSIREGHRLIKEGIYRHVRHPAYAGSLASFLGLGLTFASYLSLLIIVLPIIVAFLYRIRVEEKVLLDTFGDEYRIYCESTKRVIPGIL
jgi:protein-S-isoprenylcysteine O-methyltransferase Ste14